MRHALSRGEARGAHRRPVRSSSVTTSVHRDPDRAKGEPVRASVARAQGDVELDGADLANRSADAVDRDADVRGPGG